MVARHHAHVVGPNRARRAKIARELCSPPIHAETYESAEELLNRGPVHGSSLIADQDPAFLRFIEQNDLKPGESVRVESRDAAADSVVLRGRGRTLTIGARAASKLLVEVDGQPSR